MHWLLFYSKAFTYNWILAKEYIEPSEDYIIAFLLIYTEAAYVIDSG